MRDPALPLRTPKKQEALPDMLTMGELERLLIQPGRDELWERRLPGKPQSTTDHISTSTRRSATRA